MPAGSDRFHNRQVASRQSDNVPTGNRVPVLRHAAHQRVALLEEGDSLLTDSSRDLRADEQCKRSRNATSFLDVDPRAAAGRGAVPHARDDWGSPLTSWAAVMAQIVTPLQERTYCRLRACLGGCPGPPGPADGASLLGCCNRCSLSEMRPSPRTISSAASCHVFANCR